MPVNKYHETTGMQTKANPTRELYMKVDGVKYARYPIATPMALIGDDLMMYVEHYAKPHIEEGDVLCISTKLVSVCNKLVVHRKDVKVTWLAKFIVRFVTKWPKDIGYANPPKMQVAINMVGYPRMILAIIVGFIMKKVFKRPGYFYKVAGHQINAIDGFIPHATPPFNDYAFLPPLNADEICSDIEERFGIDTIMLDGNNIENNVMGMGDRAKERFEPKKFAEIVAGNPQGQDNDGVITPMLLVRKMS